MSDDPRGPLDFEEEPPERRDPPDTAAEERQRWGHRRDPDLEPSAAMRRGDPIPVPRAPGSSRYVWFVGVVIVLLLTVVTLNSITTEGPGARGIAPGTRMPPFAMPLAVAALDGDANVARARAQGDAGGRPACEVRGAQILNVCALWEQGPVVLGFFTDRGGECIRQVDALDNARERYPDVRFAAISIRGDRKKIRKLVRERGWQLPIGYDRDGAVANIYGVAVCPQITYARRGGKVVDTTFGELDPDELTRAIEALRRR